MTPNVKENEMDVEGSEGQKMEVEEDLIGDVILSSENNEQLEEN